MFNAIKAKVSLLQTAVAANGGIIPSAWQQVINEIISAITALEIFFPAQWDADINAILEVIQDLEGNSAAATAKIMAAAKLATPAIVSSGATVVPLHVPAVSAVPTTTKA